MTLPAALPPVIPQPFAQNAPGANINTPIPNTSGVSGLATWDQGWPTVTMQPVVAGGIPPEGQDFNGILFAITAHLYWTQAGQLFQFSSAVAAAIGGYAVGTILGMADGTGIWINQSVANTNNPDTTTGSGWVPLYSYGSTTVPLTSGTVTLTGAQAKKPVIIFTGILTGNVAVILPGYAEKWLLVNLTTGAFALTANAGGGVGQTVPQGGYGSPLGVYSIGDGNLYPSVSPLGVPISQGPDPLTLAERTNNGYLLATYFNMNAPQGDGQPVLEIMTGASDGFIRRNLVATVEAAMLLSAIGGAVTAGQVPQAAVTQYAAAILASAALTGSPTAPTPAVGDATTKVATTAFVNPGSSLNTNGYSRMPDGRIEQWGSISTTANAGTVSLPFNIPFPTACVNVHYTIIAPSGVGGAGSYENYLTGLATTTAASLHLIASSGTAITVYWSAKGY